MPSNIQQYIIQLSFKISYNNSSTFCCTRLQPAVANTLVSGGENDNSAITCSPNLAGSLVLSIPRS